MELKNELIGQETPNEILYDYLRILKSSCKDFLLVEADYREQCKHLKRCFSDADKLIKLYEQTEMLKLDFSFELGLSSNLEHFRNPDAPTFLDVDCDIYLKESEIQKNPEYVRLQTQIRELTEAMPKRVLRIYEKILEYFAFLDTYIPKMAHYYGYTIANETLKNALFDYTEDAILTANYTRWLSDYLDM